MRFTINLVSRTYLDDRQIRRWSILLLSILVLLFLWSGYRVVTSTGELFRINGEIAEQEAHFAKRPAGVSEKDFTQLTSKISFYNSIIRKKGYNWLALLDQMELVTPEGIALSLLQPDQKEQSLKIEGRAKNFRRVQTYLDTLNDSKTFTSVLLLSHAAVSSGGRDTGIQFVISCKVALP